jgi:DNA gyrase/topoisomerase IV subunit B
VKDLSIGMFTERYQKYIPKISQRFKGLGEMTPEDLYATTLDPYSRVLIQLTSEDLKKEMKVFDVLHGKKKKDKELRKKMMREYHIKPDDLDN